MKSLWCIFGYAIVFIFMSLTFCDAQMKVALPFNWGSFRNIARSMITAPSGRNNSLFDIVIRHYGQNSTSSYPIRDIKRLLSNADFDMKKPTVFYAHGYAELSSDESMLILTKAYRQNGGYNFLLLDWANLGFGNYVTAVLNVDPSAREIAKAMQKLLKRGLPLKSLHLIGHSLGVHLVACVARELDKRGYRIRRLTGLDPAFPGYYPPLLAQPISSSDAQFVDIIHTDGGGFGAPDSTGHVDFWPNEGRAKQPGCLPVTVPLTLEDFCSHWRSWRYWAESVTGGQFLARQCSNYDSFLKGKCQNNTIVSMGQYTSAKLRGNFYLRTGAKRPYALGMRGAN